jgi:glycosyltransferase involved in cell wall biosynthesis
VVCHNIVGWSAAVLPAIRSLGLPLVQVLHDQYLRCVRSMLFTTDRCLDRCGSCRLMRLPHRRLSRIPDAVVGVSRFVLHAHLADGYFQGVPIHVDMHNVSDLDRRNCPAPPPLGGPDIVFGFIGGLAPAKGIELLLQSFRAVARPNWRLRVAGTGESLYVQHLRTAYRDRRIEFLGRQDAAAFISGLDATVVPSLCDDTLPSVVFESLIHGRPVIGSRRGGIPEMVEPGRSGLLFEPDDRDGLQNAMETFAAEAPRWRSHQAAIAAEAAPRYCNKEEWLIRWEELLGRVVTRHRPAS